MTAFTGPMSDEGLLARRAEIDPRARARLRYRLDAPSPIPEARVTEKLDDLIDLIETGRRAETVYPGDEDDFEPYDQLVIWAETTVDGIARTLAVTASPDAYPEVLDRLEQLAVRQLAAQIAEERR